MKKFRGIYRIPSARAQWWDYGRDGIYFITICTKNRKFYLGDIKNGKMLLSHVGVLADVFWHEIPNHSKNVTLGEFKVMPNHIHGILILDGNENENENEKTINANANANVPIPVPIETRHALSLQLEQPPLPGQKRFRNQGKNTVSSIIGSYKSVVSKHAHRLGYEFEWQSRFWDNIIFNQESFNKITEYIKTNAERWNDDKFHQNHQEKED